MALPRLSEQFHLSPSDFWNLEWDEFDAYMKAIEESDRQAQNQEMMYG